jgi:hypothetical protein
MVSPRKSSIFGANLRRFSRCSYRDRMQRADTPPVVPGELWHVFYGLRKSIWRLWRGPLPPKGTSDFRSPGADGRMRPFVRKEATSGNLRNTYNCNQKSPGLYTKSYSWPIFFFKKWAVSSLFLRKASFSKETIWCVFIQKGVSISSDRCNFCKNFNALFG